MLIVCLQAWNGFISGDEGLNGRFEKWVRIGSFGEGGIDLEEGSGYCFGLVGDQVDIGLVGCRSCQPFISVSSIG